MKEMEPHLCSPSLFKVDLHYNSKRVPILLWMKVPESRIASRWAMVEEHGLTIFRGSNHTLVYSQQPRSGDASIEEYTTAAKECVAVTYSSQRIPTRFVHSA